MKKSSKFALWVKEYGAVELALKLGINSSSVRHWRRGTCWPTIEHMVKIRKLSKGAICCDDIVDAIQPLWKR